MSSLITHILIPLFILLIFSDKINLSKKMIILLSFFAIFPDLDMFAFHRATLHNLFIPIVLFLFIYFSTNSIIKAMVVAYYILSHIILDTFVQGVFVLYPFYHKVLNILVGITFKNNTASPIYQVEIVNELSSKSFDMAMVSSENVGTLVLIVIVLIAVIIKNKHKSLNT